MGKINITLVLKRLLYFNFIQIELIGTIINNKFNKGLP